MSQKLRNPCDLQNLTRNKDFFLSRNLAKKKLIKIKNLPGVGQFCVLVEHKPGTCLWGQNQKNVFK